MYQQEDLSDQLDGAVTEDTHNAAVIFRKIAWILLDLEGLRSCQTKNLWFDGYSEWRFTVLFLPN